jgi:hypothetical protein
MAKPPGWITLATDLPAESALTVALIFDKRGKPSVRAGLKELLEWQIKLHETPYLAEHYGEILHLAIEGDPKGLCKHLNAMSREEHNKPCVQYVKDWAIKNEWLACRVETYEKWMSTEGKEMFIKALRHDQLLQEAQELRRKLALLEEPRN